MSSNSSISFCPGSGYNFANRSQTLEWFLNGPFTATTVCLGFVLNIVCGLVFRCLPSNPIQNYLVALAVWDNLLLCNSFLLYGLPTLLYGARVRSGAYVYAYWFCYPFCNIALTASMWMTVALTFHRYRIVSNPIGYRVVSTQNRRSKLFVSAVSALAIICRLPLFFELTVGECFDKGGQDSIHSNQTRLIPMIQATFLHSNQLYNIAYRTLSSILLQSAGPLLVLLILMSRISLQLRRAGSVRRKMSCACSENDRTVRIRRHRSMENDDNLLLTCVAVKFFTCRLPAMLFEIAEAVLGANRFNRNVLIFHLVNISNALVLLNGASNFLLYLVVGCRFRQAFCQLVLRQKPTEHRASEATCASEVIELLDRSISGASGGGPNMSKRRSLCRQLMLKHGPTTYGTFVGNVPGSEQLTQSSATTSAEGRVKTIRNPLDIETRVWVV